MSNSTGRRPYPARRLSISSIGGDSLLLAQVVLLRRLGVAHLVGCAFGDHSAFGEGIDDGAVIEHDPHEVLDQAHGESEVGLQSRHEAEQTAGLLRVHPGARLVQQEEPRPAHDAPADLGAPLPAEREDAGTHIQEWELEASAVRTVEHLRNDTAKIDRLDLRLGSGEVVVDVVVRNLAGHKLPTAYPLRRAWLHVTLRDQDGGVLFESGAMRPDGSIAGNDNDADPGSFEPHHAEISAPDQVQIYESIIVDHADRVTTALLRGVRYAKDNRLLPEGFSKASAPGDVAVLGAAAGDPNFEAGSDTVRYRVPVGADVSSVTVSARLLFQTIGYRWARNLADYDAFETNRFVGYYEANAAESAVVLAAAEAEARLIRTEDRK